jgi:hypothetical protein
MHMTEESRQILAGPDGEMLQLCERSKASTNILSMAFTDKRNGKSNCSNRGALFRPVKNRWNHLPSSTIQLRLRRARDGRRSPPDP